MTQLNPATGRPGPCPVCGSTAVRWRRRRPYDVMRTYLRYIVDRIASTIFGGTRTTIVGSAYSEDANRARLASMEYREERKIYEDRVGAMTASRFWKCPDCKQKGQVFDHLDGVIEERERLIGLEGQIVEKPGAVSNPIGPDGPPGG